MLNKPVRREYVAQNLVMEDLPLDPNSLFLSWFNNAQEQYVLDANAMVLATVDADGLPDARVVLLKDVDPLGNLVFFSNYNSIKAQQLAHNNNVAVNFHWPSLSRQVRMRGIVTTSTTEVSDIYFASRPRLSQIISVASQQSTVLENQEILEQEILALESRYLDENIKRPSFWGGYVISPSVYEFWQGGAARCNDRIKYQLVDGAWQRCRLYP
jgi:pyridoxamine 5'-phosphate oxidase